MSIFTLNTTPRASLCVFEILSGHGCFGRYLWKVSRREPTPVCHQCGAEEDTAQHTLEDCPRWTIARQALTAVIGADLTLPSVVRRMVNDEQSWEAMVSFSEQIMQLKEAEERDRESDPTSNPLRRKRGRQRNRSQSSQEGP
ncbi:uncharacterized protein LOC128200985 [Galleria mellonella]|uniref:Uncharacterized protein LOC128200985 n=1 Tax=Galleria mellonella TaxID=7137 RepID=A0ABM3MMH9_GALME|nr:uncharacterized protein LOC128200985 [Galleria mellonella]